jgi:hypothetical protein
MYFVYLYHLRIKTEVPVYETLDDTEGLIRGHIS